MPDHPSIFGKRGAARLEAPIASPPESDAFRAISAVAREALRGDSAAAQDGREGPQTRAAPSPDDDMRLYIGANWGRYRALWQDMSGAPGLRASRSFAAALLTSLWLLYRKQYRLGALLLAVQLAATYELGMLSSAFDLVAAAFLGRYGKSIVLLGGAAAIARIRSAGLAPQIAATRIAAAGGGNLIAPVVGALLLLGASVVDFGGATPGGMTLDDLKALRALVDQL